MGGQYVPCAGGIFIGAIVTGVCTTSINQLFPYYAVGIGNPELNTGFIILTAQKDFGQQITIHRTAHYFSLKIIVGVGICIDLIEVINDRIGLCCAKALHQDKFLLVWAIGSAILCDHVKADVRNQKRTGVSVRISIIHHRICGVNLLVIVGIQIPGVRRKAASRRKNNIVPAKLNGTRCTTAAQIIQEGIACRRGNGNTIGHWVLGRVIRKRGRVGNTFVIGISQVFQGCRTGVNEIRTIISDGYSDANGVQGIADFHQIIRNSKGYLACVSIVGIGNTRCIDHIDIVQYNIVGEGIDNGVIDSGIVSNVLKAKHIFNGLPQIDSLTADIDTAKVLCCIG